MESHLSRLLELLGQLVGHHRRLLDITRAEREALVNADLSGVQECTYAKETEIELIKQTEATRIAELTKIALLLRKPLKDLSITQLAVAIQVRDAKRADQLRSAYNTLRILIDRITEANQSNLTLLERSIEHVQNMKHNVLGESVPATKTYGQRGQSVNNASGARLISREA